MYEVLSEPITEKEVWNKPKQIDGSKAAGYDEIYPMIAKPMAEVLMKPPKQLFKHRRMKASFLRTD